MFHFKSLVLAGFSAAAIAFPAFAGTHSATAATYQPSPVRIEAKANANLDLSATATRPASSDGSVLTAVDAFFDVFYHSARPETPDSFCLGADNARAGNTFENLKPTNPAGRQADWLKKLKKDVAATGIPDMVYVTDTYDCDDFAGDLERKLTALGYDATFTVYWCLEKDGTYSAHALTDVHAADGTVIWIEPQTGEVADLDFDGDGTVETSTTHGDYRKATDGDCRIEFYDSRAAAEKAGVIMD